MKEINFPGLCSRLIQLSAEEFDWCHRVWAAGEKIGDGQGVWGSRGLFLFSLSLAVFKSLEKYHLYSQGRSE